MDQCDWYIYPHFVEFQTVNVGWIHTNPIGFGHVEKDKRHHCFFVDCTLWWFISPQWNLFLGPWWQLKDFWNITPTYLGVLGNPIWLDSYFSHGLVKPPRFYFWPFIGVIYTLCRFKVNALVVSQNRDGICDGKDDGQFDGQFDDSIVTEVKMVTEGLTVDATESMTAQRVFDGKFDGGGDDRQSLRQMSRQRHRHPQIRLISPK